MNIRSLVFSITSIFFSAVGFGLFLLTSPEVDALMLKEGVAQVDKTDWPYILHLNKVQS